jgi:quinolinate synthase
MAESAKILNPAKTVILPEAQAHCPMAAMVTAEQLRELKSRHPQAAVVCYINSTAAVKAESDICCTSANAVEVVNSIPLEREVIFVPDRNLGAFVQRQSGRQLILWEGYCPVHEFVTLAQIEKQAALHPEAPIVVHPECPPEVTGRADAVRSTAGMLKYVKESPAREFIIGTEEGFLHTLYKNCPGKAFYLARNDFTCPDMKLITLKKLAAALDDLTLEVEVPLETSTKACRVLERMLLA